MSSDKEKIIPKRKDYKSVDPGFSIALKSHDWAIQRIESKDQAISRSINWVTGMTLGFVTFAYAQLNVTTFNFYVYIEIVFYGISLAISIYSALRGTISIPSPTGIYNKQLVRTEWNFKRWFVLRSGVAFDKNKILVERKSRCLTAILFCFILEALFLALWVIKTPTTQS